MALISMIGGGDVTQVLADEDWLVNQHIPGRLWRIGIGNNTNNTPTQIGSATSWSRVFHCGPANNASKYSADREGKIYAWGNNDAGQLGIGNTTTQSSPTQIGSSKDWRYIFAGGSNGAGIKNNGTLWTWGSGYYGLLLDGVTVSRYSPLQVGVDTDWRLVSYPHNGSMVLSKTNGNLYIQNSPYSGYSGSNTPQLNLSVTAGPWGNMRQMTADDGSVLILGEDGKMYVFDGPSFKWGSTSGTQSQNISSVIVFNSGPWISAAIMGYRFGASDYKSIVAVKEDGTLWGWGYNDLSQLGLGDTTTRTAFTQIGTSADWKQVISSGINNRAMMAVKSDGTLWGWGQNTYGILGTGDRTNKTVPTRIGSATYWKEIAFSSYTTEFLGVSYY